MKKTTRSVALLIIISLILCFSSAGTVPDGDQCVSGPDAAPPLRTDALPFAREDQTTSSASPDGTASSLSGNVSDPASAEPAYPDADPCEPFQIDDFAAGEAAPADEGVSDIGDYESSALAAVSDARIDELSFQTTVKLADPTQVRFFAVTVAKRGTLTLTMSHPAFAGESTLNIPGYIATLIEPYSSTGEKTPDSYRALTSLCTDFTSGTDISNAVGVLPGRYIVALQTYRFYTDEVVTLRCPFEARADYETECNDTPSRYNEIFDSFPMSGSISLGSVADRDCFLYRVPADGYVSLTFEHEELLLPSVAWKIGVYDADGGELYLHRARMNDKTLVSPAIGLGTGLYFIVVESHVRASIDYTLTVRFTRESYFESEPNGSPETADALESGIALGAATVSTSDGVDHDYYRFELPSRGYVKTVFVSSEQSETHEAWQLSLLDSGLNRIYVRQIAPADVSFTSPEIGLDAGEYYLLVDNESMKSTGAIYSVRFDFTPSGNCETEPNNDPEHADELMIGYPMRGAMAENGTDFDIDFFAFETADTGDITIEFDHIGGAAAEEAYVLRLLDADGRPLTLNAPDGGIYVDGLGREVKYVSVFADEDHAEFTFYSVPAGRYYVSVDTGAYYLDVNYYLTVY